MREREGRTDEGGGEMTEGGKGRGMRGMAMREEGQEGEGEVKGRYLVDIKFNLVREGGSVLMGHVNLEDDIVRSVRDGGRRSIDLLNSVEDRSKKVLIYIFPLHLTFLE